MKKLEKILMSLVLLAGFSLFFTSCQKDSSTNVSTTTSSDNTLAESSFNDLFNIVEEVEQGDESSTDKSSFIGRWSFGDCASVTIDPVGPNFPKTITIDFGDTNCVGDNGVERRGKIIATITGRLWQEGSVRTITTEDFYVDNAKVEGTKTVTNEGRNEDNFIFFSIIVENGKITPEEGNAIEWYSTREKVWIEGEETNMMNQGMGGVMDDVFLITGNGGGVNRDGINYTITITKALRVQRDCRWITEGTMELLPEDSEKRILDYGDGECDNKATVTIGDEVKEITIRRGRKM
ncbi:MAG: hypothetical protein GXO79_02370 [Chlorobi bacterium]|nr:hypothetical protein [Chlorobiota bacterium]